MAPRPSRRRRRSESASESDSDLSQEPESPKRQRLDSHSETDETTQRNGTNNHLSEAGMDEFQPGAIVRVRVENFVTYEKAEFLPGPHLNMVIGPNGTGKSSLVCAICLGLGYSPKHLGRAGAVKEFVKHGKDTAIIEIELQKRPKDRTNFVIRVQIRREQNSQKWWLNGKETSHKAIQELMRSLKIQVDNLCQFLPQDRVVEFAACTPVDLLHETLRAAAPDEMLQWQRDLRDLHKEKKELNSAASADAETLGNLESRQQGLQADVDRIREREEIQERVANLQAALAIAKYQEARGNHTEAKERRKAAERALRQLEHESGPSLEAVNQKQIYYQNLDKVISVKRKALGDAERATQRLADDIAVATEGIKELDDKQAAEHTGYEAKKKAVAACRSKMTSLQADLKNRPAEFNAADWNQKIRSEEHNLRDCHAEHRQLSTEIDSRYEKGRIAVQRAQSVQNEIDALDTQQGQQINLMRKHFPEVASGWDWIQEHQDDFEKEVFGPPMIVCSVKDERYSDQIQSLLQVDDLTCFTAQTKNDHRKLTDALYRVLSLSVVVRTCLQSVESFNPPISHDECVSLGLDGFAVDYLDGPKPVLAMLCAEKRLHQSGVSVKDHKDEEYEAVVANGKVSQWAAGKHSYTIRRRREYGPQAMTTVTKNIQRGQFWTSQPIDGQEKGEMKRRLAELKGEKDILKEEYKELRKKRDAIDEQTTQITEKIDQLKSEKSSLQKDFQKWQSIPDKIDSEERLKEAHEQAMRDARQAINDIEYDIDEAMIKRAKLVLRHTATLDKIRAAHHEWLEAQLRLIEARSDVQGLKDRNVDIMQRLDLEKNNVQSLAEEVTRARNEGRRLSDEVREVLAEHSDKKDLFTQLAEGKSPQEVEMEISAEEANLELIHAANPNVIREFERRATEIARLQKKVGASNEKLGGLNEQLANIMSQWEPKLDELVSKINDAFAYNFEQISCAGEVRVHKDDDFDQWALDIMVKFRENETLQQLTAHRQSGGERAVSTIFFLMALQSLAQSPFRVVDEINQGMDPRNERMVHERMVEIACREHTSQYFLITPKLLTGLRYDRKMRVLCIASGEHMPREGGKLDFKRCVAVHKRLAIAA